MPACNSIPLIFNCSGKAIEGSKVQKVNEAVYSERKHRAPSAKQLGQPCMACKPQQHCDILHIFVIQKKDDISLILTFGLPLKTNNSAVTTI